jgi:hypothetical protein
VDVLVTINGAPVRLLLNEVGSRRQWLQVRLLGTADNRQGLGARVGLTRPDGSVLWRQAHTDGSYLSANDPRVHFGLGTSPDVEALVVEWPRGARESWAVSGSRRLVTLTQGTGTPRP